MADNILLPSLSEDGWLTSSVSKADALFSHFILSDYSQTYIYYGNITSFPWILQKNQGNIKSLINDLQNSLTLYFGRYFNNVQVESTEEPNLNSPSKQIITIYISFEDSDNKVYNLAKLLEISDLKVKKIIDISNG